MASLGGAAPARGGETLPKGLGAETGGLVLDAVRSAGEVSAAECAELVGISRVSARRYLEHYLSSGALSLRLQYGAGRPERRIPPILIVACRFVGQLHPPQRPTGTRRSTMTRIVSTSPARMLPPC